MTQIAYIIQRIPKLPRTFVELEKSTEKFYLILEDAVKELDSNPVLAEFFAVYEVEVEFSDAQIALLRSNDGYSTHSL